MVALLLGGECIRDRVLVVDNVYANEPYIDGIKDNQ